MKITTDYLSKAIAILVFKQAKITKIRGHYPHCFISIEAPWWIFFYVECIGLYGWKRLSNRRNTIKDRLIRFTKNGNTESN